MGSRIKVTDNLSRFSKLTQEAESNALNAMAGDIQRLAIQRVPLKKGHLKGSIRPKQIAKTKYVVEANKEYAAYQEFGARASGSHRVRKYSKSGTGTGYLRDSGKTISGRINQYFTRFKARV
jgi:hypothetical protein